jgi:hypothetical protein
MGLKKLEIGKKVVKTVQEPKFKNKTKNNQILCHKSEPNPLKDRSMQGERILEF